uniref:Ovule protein n=1 Tax=Steinernema glaseri TaxID=37863 RepID=A0A1I7ZU25_9BILA
MRGFLTSSHKQECPFHCLSQSTKRVKYPSCTLNTSALPLSLSRSKCYLFGIDIHCSFTLPISQRSHTPTTADSLLSSNQVVRCLGTIFGPLDRRIL